MSEASSKPSDVCTPVFPAASAHHATPSRPGIGSADAMFDLVWAGGPCAEANATPDPGPVVRQLALGEALEVTFSSLFGGLADGGGRMSLRLLPAPKHAKSGADDGSINLGGGGAAQAVYRVIETCFPGFRAVVAGACEPELVPDLPPALTLCPKGRTLFLDGTPETGRIALAPGPRDTDQPELILPAKGALHLHPDAALQALSAADIAFRLSIRIEAVPLTINERLHVARAIRQVRPVFPDFFEDPEATRRALSDLDLLSAWMASSGGWRIAVNLQVDKDHAGIAPVIGERLFGAPCDPEGETAIEVYSDLSLAVPETGALPSPLPNPQDLINLGFAGAARLMSPKIQSGPTLVLGTAADGRQVAIPRLDLSRHALLLGSTGTGKSTLLRQMIAQDIRAGLPVVVIDAHGDLFTEALEQFGEDADDRAVIADMSGQNGTFGLDLLSCGEADRGVHAHYVANQLIGVFKRVLYADVGEAFGPMFEAYFRNALLLLMLSETPEERDNPFAAALGGAGPGLCDLDRVFNDPAFRRSRLEHCDDQQVIRFWRETALKAGGEASLENIAPYILSKLTQFTGSPLLRPILENRVQAIDFAGALDSGRSILINLAKGRTGEKDATLLGALFTIRIFGTLLERCSRPCAARPPVRIYCDEFQTYATPALGQMLAEGRKTGAQITLASQDLTSFGGSEVRGNLAGAILSNVGNLITFRVGPADAHLLADWYAPDINPQTLMRLPDRVCAARLLDGGVPQPAQLMRTLDDTRIDVEGRE